MTDGPWTLPFDLGGVLEAEGKSNATSLGISEQLFHSGRVEDDTGADIFLPNPIPVPVPSFL